MFAVVIGAGLLATVPVPPPPTVVIAAPVPPLPAVVGVPKVIHEPTDVRPVETPPQKH